MRRYARATIIAKAITARGHPIPRGLGEKLQPFVVSMLVEQFRFSIVILLHEILALHEVHGAFRDQRCHGNCSLPICQTAASGVLMPGTRNRVRKIVPTRSGFARLFAAQIYTSFKSFPPNVSVLTLVAGTLISDSSSPS